MQINFVIEMKDLLITNIFIILSHVGLHVVQLRSCFNY